MRVGCLVALVALVLSGGAGATVGDVRVLVTGASPQQVDSAAAFIERSSFGRLHLHIDVTGAPDAYDAVVPPGPNLVRRLGLAFGLKPASRDPLSPMGKGKLDFGAYEKSQLGWISVERADSSRTYTLADIDQPSSSPQALVVTTAAGEYWIEHRAAPNRLVVRRKQSFVAQPRTRYVKRGVFGVTRMFAFRWLDKKRPSTPIARALDNAFLSWTPSRDAGSGVANYRVSVDGELLVVTTGLGTALPALSDGGHRVTVVAVDRAGNRSLPGAVSLSV